MNGADYNFQALRAARIAAGFPTQKAAAEELHINYKTLSRIERGDAASFEIIKRMCETYGISLHSVIYDTSQKKFHE